MRTMLPTFATLAIATAFACSDDDAAGTSTRDAGTDGAASEACPAGYFDCDGNPATLCETRTDSDPAHCGGCSTLCPTGVAHQRAVCVTSRCGLVCEPNFVDCDQDPTNGCETPAGSCGVTVLASYVGPGGIAIDDAFVYYAAKGASGDPNGSVLRVAKSGGATTTLATGLNRPISIVIDGPLVISMNGGNGMDPDSSLVSFPKEGGPVTPIVNGVTRLNNAVRSGDDVFFTTRDLDGGNIRTVKLDSGADANDTPAIVVPNVTYADDLVIDGDRLVWASTTLDGGGAVERSLFDGGSRTLLTEAIHDPSFKIAPMGDAVIVGSRSEGTVRNVSLINGATTLLASNLGSVQELIIDGAFIYATTGSGRRVVAIPLAGGTPVVLADAQVFPSYLALDAEYVYFTDGPLSGAATIKKAKR